MSKEKEGSLKKRREEKGRQSCMGEGEEKCISTH